jgi:hypothetical protein
MEGTPGLQEAVNEVDQRDGQLDQRWLGNPILPIDGRVRYTPAWSIYQTRRLTQMLKLEGFGTDAMPDLFFTNYKTVDLASHTWFSNEPETRDDLAEQDAQIPLLVHALDQLVGRRSNYVLALTADHGVQPPPIVTKGWSIEIRDMTKDILKRFDHTTPDIPLILSNRGYSISLNQNELQRNHVTAEDIAGFVRNYRIQDNLTPTNTVLPRFEGRTDERLYLTALTPTELSDALACAQDKQAALHLDEKVFFAARIRKSGLPST